VTTPDRTSQARKTAAQRNLELADFFGLLGARLEYDRAKTDAATPGKVATPTPPRRTPGHSSRRRRRLVSLAAALACLILIAIVTLPRVLGSATVPDELLGTWRTSADGYARRGFTLTPGSVVLNAGPDGRQVSTYTITRVRTTTQGAETVYAIQYQVEDGRYELSLRYLSGPPSVIRFSHQRELAWSKVGIGG
jgi:hypothetical protein